MPISLVAAVCGCATLQLEVQQCSQPPLPTTSGRLSTVRDADIIAVVNRGRILEQGSHEEVCRGGGCRASAAQPLA